MLKGGISMRRGSLFLLRRLFLFVLLFSVLTGTCGFKIKVTTVYGDATSDEAVADGAEEAVINEELALEEPVFEQGNIEEGNYRTGLSYPEDMAPSVVLPEIIEDNGSDIFLIGDSRTVYAYMDLPDPRANWLAACGTSYPYFVEHYLPIVDRADLNGKKIVILYGVNDIFLYGKETAAANWLNFYNTTVQKWIGRGAQVYACSVLGFDYMTLQGSDSCTYSQVQSMNKTVDEYNILIQSLLPANVGYIRLHPSTDRPFRDGVHYSEGENRYIYKGIIDRLSIM